MNAADTADWPHCHGALSAQPGTSQSAPEESPGPCYEPWHFGYRCVGGPYEIGLDQRPNLWMTTGRGVDAGRSAPEGRRVYTPSFGAYDAELVATTTEGDEAANDAVAVPASFSPRVKTATSVMVSPDATADG